MLIDLHPDPNAHPIPPLHVLAGTGDDIATLIRGAVEDDLACAGAHLPRSPHSQTMSRTNSNMRDLAQSGAARPVRP